MEKYKNVSGQSWVSEYEIGDDFITVKFLVPSPSGATTYKYSYASAGKDIIEKMKELAIAGEGLKTYITASAHDLYESKS